MRLTTTNYLTTTITQHRWKVQTAGQKFVCTGMLSQKSMDHVPSKTSLRRRRLREGFWGPTVRCEGFLPVVQFFRCMLLCLAVALRVLVFWKCFKAWYSNFGRERVAEDLLYILPRVRPCSMTELKRDRGGGRRCWSQPGLHPNSWMFALHALSLWL